MGVKITGLVASIVTGIIVVLAGSSVSAAGPLYVALGDSYSAGVGADIDPTKAQPIANSFDPASGACQRAYKAYPNLIAPQYGAQLRNVACSGATTADIVGVGGNARAPQIDAVTADAQLVTITIGGNDIGFGSLMGCIKNKECTGSEPEAVATLNALNNDLWPRLINVFTQIKQRAPNALILVGGYPQIYPNAGQSAGTCASYLSQGEMDGWNYIQSTMNRYIKETAMTVGGNIRYVDTYAPNTIFTKKSIFGQTKDACSTWNQRIMNGYPTTSLSASLHPNLLGQQAYATLFKSYIY